MLDIYAAVFKTGYNEYCNVECDNLDKLIEQLVVNDYLNYRYDEQFFIGENNLEVNFVNSKVKK